MPKFIIQMIGTYILVMIGQFMFRAESMSEVISIIGQIPKNINGVLFIDFATMANSAICLVALIYVDIQEEWFPNKKLWLPSWSESYRWELTVAIEILAIVLFGVFDSNQFIYFQF